MIKRGTLILASLRRFLSATSAYRLCLTVATVCLLTAGYILTYQLFFVELPLEQVAITINGGEQKEFRYDGVVYFRGIEVGAGDTVELTYESPRILEKVNSKQLEFFLQVNQDGAWPQEPVGQLTIAQGTAHEPIVWDVLPQQLQRFAIPWQASSFRTNTLQVTFTAADAITTPAIVFATNIRNINLSLRGLFWAGLGLVLFVAAGRLKGKVDQRLVAIVTLTLVTMTYFHSGALISNHFFPGSHYKVSAMITNVGRAVRDGHFKEVMYRSTGFSYVPALTIAVESTSRVGFHGYRDVYPTSRYVMFGWVALALVMLVIAVYRNIHPWAALAVGLIYATFYPFMVDLYFADADAYFIPFMTMLLAVFLNLTGGYLKYRQGLIALSVIMVAMGSVKVTSALLVPLLPLATWARTIVTRRTLRDRKSLGLFLALVVSFLVGSQLSSAFQHPQRHVGIEGVKFQDNVFWHMLWAATGHYDSYTAHNFTSSAGLRNRRVAEITGLPADLTYIRHSQMATEMVYKPGVLNALKERPGIFYSTAYFRIYQDGYTFMKHNGTRLWEEIVEQPSRQLEMIRFGEMWKIAPLVLLAKLEEHDMTRMVDLLLIIIALAGIGLLRRADLLVLLYGLVAAKVVFRMWIHSLERYMMFTNVALIIGLAVFVVVATRALWSASGMLRSVEQSTRQRG